MWRQPEDANELLQLCRVKRYNHIDVGDDIFFGMAIIWAWGDDIPSRDIPMLQFWLFFEVGVCVRAHVDLTILKPA